MGKAECARHAQRTVVENRRAEQWWVEGDTARTIAVDDNDIANLARHCQGRDADRCRQHTGASNIGRAHRAVTVGISVTEPAEHQRRRCAGHGVLVARRATQGVAGDRRPAIE